VLASCPSELLEDAALASVPASEAEELDVDEVVADDDELPAAVASAVDEEELVPPPSSPPGLPLFEVEHAANWPTTTTSDTIPSETRLIRHPLPMLKTPTQAQDEVEWVAIVFAKRSEWENLSSRRLTSSEIRSRED
jgi:hypothetical protein